MSDTLNIENATIGYRNFRGETSQFNQDGTKSFHVFLSDEDANRLSEEGWNVKWPKPRPDLSAEEDQRSPHMEITISEKFYPSKINLVAGDTLTRLDPEDADILDWSELDNVDLVIRPYNWEVNGNKGIKAYLKAGYFTIVTDEFASKYESMM